MLLEQHGQFKSLEDKGCNVCRIGKMDAPNASRDGGIVALEMRLRGQVSCSSELQTCREQRETTGNVHFNLPQGGLLASDKIENVLVRFASES